MRKRIKNLAPGDGIIDHGHGYRKVDKILQVDHGPGYTAVFCEDCTYLYRDCEEQGRVKVLDPSDTSRIRIKA